MAKSGEGDARWIVADRKDGTNVHNWHWAEKDVSVWAKAELQSLLGDLSIEGAPGVTLRTAEEVTVSGEAVVNNRKNKLIPAYELEIRGVWSGTSPAETSGEAADVSGQFKIPYLAEENADEDPELLVSSQQEDTAHRKAKEAFLSVGKKEIYARLRKFVKQMASGGPIAKDGQFDAPKQGSSHEKAKVSSTEAAVPHQPQKKNQTSSSAQNRKSFSSTEKFYARASDIFECFTDAQKIQAYTQSPAKVVAREGGDLEMFGGSVIGTFRQLIPNSHIVLDWRFRTWQESDKSQVDLRFEEPEPGTTIVTLEHTKIPEEDQFGNSDVYDTTAAGWKQQIFHKIRAVFGYGLGL